MIWNRSCAMMQPGIVAARLPGSTNERSLQSDLM